MHNVSANTFKSETAFCSSRIHTLSIQLIRVSRKSEILDNLGVSEIFDFLRHSVSQWFQIRCSHRSTTLSGFLFTQLILESFVSPSSKGDICHMVSRGDK